MPPNVSPMTALRSLLREYAVRVNQGDSPHRMVSFSSAVVEIARIASNVVIVYNVIAPRSCERGEKSAKPRCLAKPFQVRSKN